MIRSMTGYGAAEVATEAGRLSAEIRSVNHRYCEISLRLPRSVSGLEGPVRQHLTERLSRGKINLTVSWEGYEEEGGRLRVNHDVARQVVAALTELKDKYELSGALDARAIASMPDVLTWDRPPVDDIRLWEQLKKVLDGTLDNMAQMKVREGDSLRREFETRLESIERLLARAEERAPLRPREAQERMLARLKPLLDNIPIDPVRVAQEIAFLAERLDCTEECVRMRAHLDQFRRLFADAEPAGRKLNFLLQEMNREVNTLGSKGNDAVIAEVVIELKDEIEKVREQVQNVE
ncbi:MAG: YicC/YloC family endoribonuclease [Candidatus Eisenbacteria bacterium]